LFTLVATFAKKNTGLRGIIQKEKKRKKERKKNRGEIIPQQNKQG